MADKAGGKGNKKYSRGKKKALGRSSPISLFVRNKISAKTYWDMTGQSLRNAVKDAS